MRLFRREVFLCTKFSSLLCISCPSRYHFYLFIFAHTVHVKYKKNETVSHGTHYEKTPIQNRKFSDKKNSDNFFIFAQNIDCGYSLEPPPVNPSFTI